MSNLSSNIGRGRARRGQSARHRAVALAGVVLLIGLLALIAMPDGGSVTRAAARTRQPAAPALTGAGTAAATTTAAGATVTMNRHAPTVALPRSFLGFSIEVGDVLHYAPYLGLFGRAFGLIRVPGDGPQVLRIGGNSTDQSYFEQALPIARPPAFELGRDWLRDAGRIVRALHLRVILGLNAVSRRPAMAVRLARATLRALPARSVIGFEIGNEPDLYRHRFGGPLAAAVLRGRTQAQRQSIFSAAGYTRTFAVYASQLRRLAPRVPEAGPAVANPLNGRRWLTGLIAQDRPSLGMLTAHRYPLSACAHSARSPGFPTIARLLSERTSAGLAAAVAPAVALAHRNRLPFRLTEFNSVTCLGRPGVSNTFATALWAPDALFEMLRVGVNGVNMHLRTFSINAPFLLDSDGFVARPAIYGLATFARTLGPGARLTPMTVRGARGVHLNVWGVLLRGHRLHVLVLDKGARAARVSLRLPGARGEATVERLIAPSVHSEHGVTLAGQSLDSHGRWIGAKVIEHVSSAPGGYGLVIGGYSGALVSVRL